MAQVSLHGVRSPGRFVRPNPETQITASPNLSPVPFHPIPFAPLPPLQPSTHQQTIPAQPTLPSSSWAYAVSLPITKQPQVLYPFCLLSSTANGPAVSRKI